VIDTVLLKLLHNVLVSYFAANEIRKKYYRETNQILSCIFDI